MSFQNTTRTPTTQAPTLAPSLSPTSGEYIPTVNDTNHFVFDLYVSLPITFFLVASYCLVRRWKPEIFEKRRQFAKKRVPSNSEERREEKKEEKEKEKVMWEEAIEYPKLGENDWVKWMYDIWKMDSSEFYKYAGLDAVIMRTFVRGCMYISLWCMAYGFVILIPVYATSTSGGGDDDGSTHLLAVTSMSNLGTNSPRFWAVAIGVYYIMGVSLFYFSKMYLSVAYVTDKYMAATANPHDINAIDTINWLNYADTISHVVQFNVQLLNTTSRRSLQQTELQSSSYQKTFQREEAELSEDETGEKQQLLKKQYKEETVGADIDVDETKTPYGKGATYPPFAGQQSITYDASLVDFIPIDRFTVMIRDLPKDFRNQQTLEKFFNMIFPGQIA
ncbi:hypothetical protein RFI_30334 [Reticulomyxa filosa]|uniref:CSC1/OSCA1-like N-terminal transmembrane domain-containing protein n=1 Tax=Reticulomyxa filosa TaxID=46433 RepID=X6M248_RETFI|nr:hypothetical protein RFI_30334 [Reticulomyxa filosa]|eukprot:ETO07060.1 hypothetical protein RFI_30334 [Reticulomyxa filosa]